jgi:multidrug efflux system membrane fusion protein
MRLKTIVICVLVVAGAWFFFHKSDSGNSGKHAGNGAPVTVGLAKAKTGDINVYLIGIGNVTPPNTITLHSRVDGELMTLPFKEGQFIKKGQLLAELDPRPYAAALEQAQGQLKRDTALLEEARIDLQRYIKLASQDSIATQQVDLQTSLVKQYQGSVLNDKGLVHAAETNLAYTKIIAPAGGRIGLRQIDPGNIVHSSDSNGVIVITQLQPITVIFTLPEDNIPQVQDNMNGNKILAEAWDRENKHKLADGIVYAVDNQVDPTTGTVKLRAEFANEDNKLFPSQFVNIRCLVETKKDVVIMPAAAVQHGADGTFVYLVRPDSTVTVQKVKIGITEGDNVAVDEGIKADDEVVVDGADGLREGAKINPAQPKMADAAPAVDKTDKPDNQKHQHKQKKKDAE